MNIYLHDFELYLNIPAAVRTRLDDGKLLPAKSITVSVRCYEARLGKVNALHTNVLVDYTEVLWSAPHLQEYAEVGDGEYPFRITIPANVAGHSTANYQDYRVWWRVEASAYHPPTCASSCHLLIICSTN